MNKATLKKILGEIPWTAELYWQIRRQRKPLSKSFSLRRTQHWLPTWKAQAEAARLFAPAGKKVLMFATLRYWIEHATLLGLSLAGQGHSVTLAFLPYANWRQPLNRFDLRRQNLYARSVLKGAAPLLNPVSFLDKPQGLPALPAELERAIQKISEYDVQYTLQVEEVDHQSHLYRLRLARNTHAARAGLAWLRKNRPEVVITPNGSILEMGAVYQVARYLEIPVVTYEFGEQRGRIWLAQNREVMLQETDDLWQARQDIPLTESQWEQVRALYASRQGAKLWENFSRLWQGQPGLGGEQARQALGLDGRPIALLAANVIGDSLTLGRQVFSESMTEWLQHTIRYFAQRTDVQLVVRVHPGERYTKGPSVAFEVRKVLDSLPTQDLSHIHIVAFDAPVNTYDLVEIASLGLVYTTTVGLEMAMSGVPVVAAGQTHYRGKGFTLDPADWESYFELLGSLLADPAAHRPSRAQVEQAWKYAYRFFFDYPLPFPWHLLHFWNELETCSLESALSEQGMEDYGEAFRYLTGEHRSWT